MAGHPYPKTAQCGPARQPARKRPLPNRSPKRQLEAGEREHVRLAVIHPREAHALRLVRWSWEPEPTEPIRPEGAP